MRPAVDNPIACTLDSSALRQRLAWIARITNRSLLRYRIDGAVLRLSYRTDAFGDLEQIVAQERECCPFLTYTLTAAKEVTLSIEAPAGAGPDARWLFDQFLPRSSPGDAPKACGCGPGACR